MKLLLSKWYCAVIYGHYLSSKLSPFTRAEGGILAQKDINTVSQLLKVKVKCNQRDSEQQLTYLVIKHRTGTTHEL
jgi:hypothetical protein